MHPVSRSMRALTTCHLSISMSKEMMKRTRLRNHFSKNRTDESKSRYAKQRNYCVSLFKKTKAQYYSNLDIKNITDKKPFWKTFSSRQNIVQGKNNINRRKWNCLKRCRHNSSFEYLLNDIVGSLNIPEYVTNDPSSDSVLAILFLNW